MAIRVNSGGRIAATGEPTLRAAHMLPRRGIIDVASIPAAIAREPPGFVEAHE